MMREMSNVLQLLVLLAVFVLGLAILGFGRDIGYVLHGWIIAIVAGWAAFWIIDQWSDPKQPIRVAYKDRPTKVATLICFGWAVFGFTIGDLLAWQLAIPALNGDMAATNFGRIRPMHTTAVIFGFGGNALIATSYYVVQRTCRARLASETLPWLVLGGYNLFLILAVTGYPFGITQSKEYAEPEWYADLILLITWMGYFTLYMKTLARRVEPHIYVANWYYLGFIVVIAMLHTVNNLAVPITISEPKSYPLFSGIQDAMTQWWYGHNAVGFLLTSGFLGMMYYFLPKSIERPIYSYRMSILGFWGITFLYLWVGSHHLHYTALPDWVQYLGATMSIILLVPSWGTVFNGLLTLNGAWDKVRTDPAVRFMMVAILFYGLTTFEGSFMAIRSVNTLSHYTDWTVGHVHAGALGWVAFMTFGVMYKMVPWVWNREGIYSLRLEAWHFWLALSGTLIYVGAMWNSGITQSLMWQTYEPSGAFTFAFIDTVEAMVPYYWMRAIGGALYLLGALIGSYNIAMTVRGAPRPGDASHSGPIAHLAE